MAMKGDPLRQVCQILAPTGSNWHKMGKIGTYKIILAATGLNLSHFGPN